MKVIKVELNQVQLDEIMGALEMAIESFNFMTHHSKFATEKESSRLELIRLTYELLLSYRIEIDKQQNIKNEKNYKKIS